MCAETLNEVSLRNGENFSSAPVVKNPPADAGDVGSVPGPESPHVLQGNETHALQLLSPVVVLWSPMGLCTLDRVLHNKKSRRSQKPACHSEKPEHRSQSSPYLPQLEKVLVQQ